MEIVVILLLVGLDQLVKDFVKTNIALGTHEEFIDHVLALAHIHNTGAAFSMLTGARWFFVVLTVAFVAFALWVLFAKKITHPFGRWTLVLIIAGAIGNLIDRAIYGYVVDMFETLFMDFPIFNVADIYVTCGGILFCIYYAFIHDKYKAKQTLQEQNHEDTV